MKKICFVIQRYGEEVNGGAELLCKQLAERLVPSYEIHVLTTKAIDYMTWGDEYHQDEENINGVTVHRFSVDKTRTHEEFDGINDLVTDGSLPLEREDEWLEKEGPYVPELVRYIKAHKDCYDVFIFMTYIYYPTVKGIPQVKDKAIFLPLAHSEPMLHLNNIRRIFDMPKAFFFNTDEERKLVRQNFNNCHIPYLIGGAGVDVPEHVDGSGFKKKYCLNNYIVYVGRIDLGKNCPEMFEFFLRYKNEHPSDLKLVLMGKSVIPIPETEDIISLGFVSDKDKFDGISGSRFLLLPSKFESLSMVVLEAFSLSVPVLVNESCDVLKAHCQKSNGGLYYRDYESFEATMTYLLTQEEIRNGMGKNGCRYVEDNYNWDNIIKKLSILIDYVDGGV